MNCACAVCNECIVSTKHHMLELQDGLAPHKTSSKRRDLNIEKPPATTATNAKNEGDIKRLSEKVDNFLVY